MWLAVDESGEEYIYSSRPSRGNLLWVNAGTHVKVPKGTIQRLLNYPLTWDDDCQEIVEYKDNNILKEFKVIKQNIKMRVTPEQNRKIQEVCFANGIYWAVGRNIIQNENQKYLYLNDEYITFGDTYEYFEEHDAKEIDADLFIRTNGTCEDTTLSDDNIDFADIKIKVDDKQKTAIVNILNSMCLNYLVIGDYIYTDEDVIVKNIDNLEINEIDANCFIKKYANNDYQGTEAELLLSKMIDFKDEELEKHTIKIDNLKKQLEKYVVKIANQKEEITRLLAYKERLQQMLMMPCKSVDNNNLVKLLEEKDAIIKYLENKLEI